MTSETFAHPCPRCGTMIECVSTRAGGGQAGDELTSPTGDLPVDAPGPPESLLQGRDDRPVVTTDTAADLHRWYCGPWCKECGFVLGASGDDCERIDCPHDFKPGLHARDPRTKVEGLEYGPHPTAPKLVGERWYMAGVSEWSVKPAIAADILVMGKVKTLRADQLEVFWREVAILMYDNLVTMPEAVATAAHHMLNAEDVSKHAYKSPEQAREMLGEEQG